MAIKDSEVERLVRAYNLIGFLNVVITGDEGVGKTLFGSQLLVKVCERIYVEPHDDMIYYDFSKFLKSTFSIRYLAGDILYHQEFNFSENVFDELKGKINIFEIYNKSDLKFLENIPYYEFKITSRGVYLNRGRQFNFDPKLPSPFNRETLELRKKEQILKRFEDKSNSPFENIKYDPELERGNTWEWKAKEVKEFMSRLRRERHQTPQFIINRPHGDDGMGKSTEALHQAILWSRIPFIIKSNAGVGKSDRIERKNSMFTNKKFRTLFLLYWSYCFLIGLLCVIINIFSTYFALFIFGMGCIIGWEEFVKPMIKIEGNFKNGRRE